MAGGELPSVGVLIIDDDEDAREMLAIVLAKAGYTVATARDGREGLERLHALRPQLILLDVCMPIMDGATFRQEQRRHWEWLRIPTVVMTGANEETMLDPAVEDTLRKPIAAAVLLDLVKRHCTPVRDTHRP